MKRFEEMVSRFIKKHNYASFIVISIFITALAVYSLIAYKPKIYMAPFGFIFGFYAIKYTYLMLIETRYD